MANPAFRVLIDDRQDVTDAIAQRLVSLVVSDRAGWESDSCRIRIGDAGRSLEIPRRGAAIEVSMGYGATLAAMGRFTVDEVVVSDPPPELLVTGRAADFRETLKTRRTRSWHDTTLGSLVSSIAREHGLRAAVARSLRAVRIPHLDQADESDLGLLARAAEERDATFKLANGAAVIAPRGAGQSASGLAIDAVRIPADSVVKRRAVLADRPLYASASATWRSADDAQTHVETAGSGSPAYRLPWLFGSQAEAAVAAQAKLRSLARLTATLRLEMPGNPAILSGTPLELEEARPGVLDRWVAVRVDHVIDRRGYITRIAAEGGD